VRPLPYSYKQPENLKNDGFHYQRKTLNIEREESLDGIYVIRTSVKSEALSSQQVVATYKSLSGVERAFPSLKTVDLQVRPIHHRLPDRVRAHILLCMLAYYVEMIINKRAHRARIPRRQTETNSQSPSARAFGAVMSVKCGAARSGRDRCARAPRILSLLMAVSLSVTTAKSQSPSHDWSSNRISHVLLISIDGMHAVDYINCSSGTSGVNSGEPYCPNLASLGKTGLNYLNTSTSKPSDSFPGLMALVSGGSPRTVGAFYDVAYDRSLDPPSKTTGNGVAAGTCVAGAAPTGNDRRQCVPRRRR
jgi:hypothetical protein